MVSEGEEGLGEDLGYMTMQGGQVADDTGLGIKGDAAFGVHYGGQ